MFGECAEKGSPLYMADDLMHVIFNVLKFPQVGGLAAAAKAHHATFVDTYYQKYEHIDDTAYVDHVRNIIKGGGYDLALYFP